MTLLLPATHTHQAWCSRGCLGSGKGACWIQLSAPRGSREGLRMGVFPENIIDPHCSFVTHSFKVTFSFWGGKSSFSFPLGLGMIYLLIHSVLLSFVFCGNVGLLPCFLMHIWQQNVHCRNFLYWLLLCLFGIPLREVNTWWPSYLFFGGLSSSHTFFCLHLCYVWFIEILLWTVRTSPG